MNEFLLFIEEWETDIQLLHLELRHFAPQGSAPQALAERRCLEHKLHQARQAQGLLHDLAQVHPGAVSLAA